jgi:DNA-binding GntR family transcriptional regulator
MSETEIAKRPFTTKTEWVYSTLRGRIITGAVKPGDRLRLTELALELGVSEMPVREALRMLDRDRLVTMESHRGATVVDLSLELAAEIVTVRTHLEMLAFEDAIGRHVEADLDGLDLLLNRMAKALYRNDSRRFSEINRDFHRNLYAPGRNQTLKSEIEALWDRLWLTRDRSIFALKPERMIEAHREHLEMVAMLRAGKKHSAIKAAKNHRSATMAAWAEIAASAGRCDDVT